MLQMQRYQLGQDWSPIKLEVCLDVPTNEDMDRSFLRASGPMDGEVLIPDDDNDGGDEKNASLSSAAGGPGTKNEGSAVGIDEVARSQLMDMGFSLNSCKRALNAVGGSNVEAAMGWVFEHNMDPDFNDPLPEEGGTGGGKDPSSGTGASGPGDGSGVVEEAVVESLVASLGCFTSDQVRAALEETSGSAERAADWLFSHMDDLDGAIAGL